jgi:hypothetical protein
MFLGILGLVAFRADGGCGFEPVVRQLVADTLVAVVDTLRTLALLYRVNADVDVPALEVVLVELRQLPDTIELALDPIGRPLRTEFGDVARSECKSASQWSLPGCGLRDELYVSRSRRVAGSKPPAGTGSRARRPRGRSSADALGADGGEASSPMIRLVTLLAVADIKVGGTGRSGMVSSTGETRPTFKALLLPKLSFHFDGFFVIEGAGMESEAEAGGATAGLGATGFGVW